MIRENLLTWEANSDFPCAKLEKAKKNCQIFFLAIMTKPGAYID